MRVLAIAAHPDDEVLGCGGTLLRHKQDGDDSFVILLGEGPTSRGSGENQAAEEAKKAQSILGTQLAAHLSFPDQRFDTLALLDVAKELEKHIDQIKPDIVYTHHYSDINQDHRVTSEAVMIACRAVPGQFVKRVYFWENLSSTEWSPKANPFKAQHYVDIHAQLPKKIEAMKAYSSELREFPHPRSIKGIESLAQLRGCEAGFEAAEAFELFRSLR